MHLLWRSTCGLEVLYVCFSPNCSSFTFPWKPDFALTRQVDSPWPLCVCMKDTSKSQVTQAQAKEQRKLALLSVPSWWMRKEKERHWYGLIPLQFRCCCFLCKGQYSASLQAGKPLKQTRSNHTSQSVKFSSQLPKPSLCTFTPVSMDSAFKLRS